MSDIARENAVQRACQAAIRALPAVSTRDTAQGSINDLGDETGDVVELTGSAMPVSVHRHTES
jgi:hypothetical protein